MTAVLSHDTECVACGHNLRSLSPEGLCPECGEPVATSLPRFAEPARTAVAVRLAAWSFAVAGLTLVPTDGALPFRFQIWFAPAGMMLLAAAAWRLHSGCRLERLSALGAPLRRLRAAAVWLWLADIVTAVLVGLAHLHAREFLFTAGLTVFALPATVSARAWLFARVGRALAMRAARPRLAGFLRWAAWFWSAAAALLVLVWIAIAAAALDSTAILRWFDSVDARVAGAVSLLLGLGLSALAVFGQIIAANKLAAALRAGGRARNASELPGLQ